MFIVSVSETITWDILKIFTKDFYKTCDYKLMILILTGETH